MVTRENIEEMRKHWNGYGPLKIGHTVLMRQEADEIDLRPFAQLREILGFPYDE